MKKTSLDEHLMPARLSFTDEPRKVYVGRLPKGAPDSLVETILKTCCGDLSYGNGTLKSWKRTFDASGVPKAFGYAEFDSLEVVYVVHRLLNNAAMTFESFSSRLLVNFDEKTK